MTFRVKTSHYITAIELYTTTSSVTLYSSLCESSNHISLNKVNIGNSGAHAAAAAVVVYPWLCAPVPVCLLFSSKLGAFTLTVLSSTNYFFKERGVGRRPCRQTQPG